MTGWLCALPLVASLLGFCAERDVLATGYVEGEYVQLAPVGSAELERVEVALGDRVEPGQVVARQERTDAEIALAEAEAAREQAAAELADLREGKRPEEIAVIEASLAAARARLHEAERDAERQQSLAGDGFVPQAVLDAALTARDVARTELAQLQAELEVARLPARPKVVAAAESRLEGAEAAARAARWRLDKRVIRAPVAGEVTEVFRRVGELAGPAEPVIEVLPDGAWKLVVFVSEPEVADLSPGDVLAVRCDGCPEGLTATVSHLADGPEFTPPVIYSVQNRQKLVYRVEARPAAGAEVLRPGQIVDVARP